MLYVAIALLSLLIVIADQHYHNAWTHTAVYFFMIIGVAMFLYLFSGG